MRRRVVRSFGILLGVASLGLIAAGGVLLGAADADPLGAAQHDAGTSSDGVANGAVAIAGASLFGFGLLGAIGATVLLLMTRAEDAVRPPAPDGSERLPPHAQADGDRH